jgi:hypothetical protein
MPLFFGGVMVNTQKTRLAYITWIFASIFFSVGTIYGVYIEKVIVTVNGETPPLLLVLLFIALVVVLLKYAIRDMYRKMHE